MSNQLDVINIVGELNSQCFEAGIAEDWQLFHLMSDGCTEAIEFLGFPIYNSDCDYPEDILAFCVKRANDMIDSLETLTLKGLENES